MSYEQKKTTILTVPLNKHKEAQYLAISGQKSIREFSLQYVYNNSMQQVLVETLIVPSYSRNSPHFMKTDGELPCSIEFATCSCLEPAQSSSRSHHFFCSRSNNIISSTSRLSKWPFSLRFLFTEVILLVVSFNFNDNLILFKIL